MIFGYLFGDEAAVARMKGAKERAAPAIRATIGRLVLRLVAKVKDEKLSGQVLNVRTGRLRRSIHGRVEDGLSGPVGIVGTNVSYARAHELGFKGPVTVKEHIRRIRDERIKVRQHVRQMNLPARSFLGSALAEMRPEIRAELQATLREIVR